MATISKETHPLGGVIRKKPDEVHPPAPPETPKSLGTEIADWIARFVVLAILASPLIYIGTKIFGSDAEAPADTGPLVLRGALPTTGEVENGWTDPTAPAPTPEPAAARQPTHDEQMRNARADPWQQKIRKAVRSAGYWCDGGANVTPDYWGSDANQKRYRIVCDSGGKFASYTFIQHYSGRVELFPN